MFHTVVGSFVATICVSFKMKQIMSHIIGHPFFVWDNTFPGDFDDYITNTRAQNFPYLSRGNKLHEKCLRQEIFFLSLAVRWLGPGEHPTVYGSCGLVKLREWSSFLSWFTEASESPFLTRLASKRNFHLFMPSSVDNMPRAPDSIGIREK
jgi:hypothetical protein